MSSNPLNEKEIFDVARAIETHDARTAYIRQVCGNDMELSDRINALLEGFEKQESFLEEPAADILATEIRPISEQPGDTIGPYKLLQQIGEGGMGTVFMAEQSEPVERRVALKIIKPGMDTQQVIARFEAERQALAMMDHPNIAKVFDAGTTNTGRPYFVMELVKGIPVTKYCDQEHLTVKERLELFLPICQAIQHAHNKGIIHRDVKPTNILVARYDGKPVPKVIDFGVSKATSHRLTEKTMFTQYGQIVGTIEYMSPEQAEFNQLDIDTRSDIYSLGVVLYELLTSETPFDKQRLRSAAFEELLRIIREEEPPRPSTKLSTSHSVPNTAVNRRVEPNKLSLLVRGELDWIVMKALEKDRGRRYETASAFAGDVQHYLNDEAVEACPPSVAYKFRKFARRNKAIIGTTAAIAASLIAGLVGTTWQAYRALNAERDALEFAADARVQAARADEEAEEAQHQAAIARYLAEGSFDLAEREVLQELDIHKMTFGEKHPQTLSTMNMLAIIYHHQGRNHDAVQLLEQKLEIERRTVGDEHDGAIQSANFLANLYQAEARYAEAEQLHRRLVEIRKRTLGEKHPDTLQSMNSLASTLSLKGDRDGAIDIYQDLLNLDSNYSYVRGQLAGTLRRRAIANEKLGRFPEVIADLRRIVELLRNQSGTSGRLPLAATLLALGEVLDNIGQTDDAVSVYRDGLTILQRLVEDVPDHEPNRIKLGEMYRRLGHALQRRKDCEEALSCFENSLEAAPGHYLSHQSMAGFLIYAGDVSFRDFDRAAQHAARAVELNPRSEKSHRLLGWARYNQQDWSGAIESLTRALELGFHIDARIGLQLAVCYAHLNEQKQGAEWYATGVALLDKEEKQANQWLSKLREEAEELLEIPTPQTVRN